MSRAQKAWISLAVISVVATVLVLSLTLKTPPGMSTGQFWLMFAQTVATAILGIGAIAVAAVSATLAYRNNFGWEPNLSNQHLLTFSGNEYNRAAMHGQFIFWNRRQYPISIDSVQIRIENGEFDDSKEVIVSPKFEALVSKKGISINYHRLPVEKLSSEFFQWSAEIVKSADGKIQASARVEVRYFDPRLHQLITIPDPTVKASKK